MQVDRLMDLIVNSLYSNREVFLRELVSNASDALDKLRFIGLTDPSVMEPSDALEIRIKADKEAGTIVIECVPLKSSHGTRALLVFSGGHVCQLAPFPLKCILCSAGRTGFTCTVAAAAASARLAIHDGSRLGTLFCWLCPDLAPCPLWAACLELWNVHYASLERLASNHTAAAASSSLRAQPVTTASSSVCGAGHVQV
jgi:hypothetical protein